MHADSWLVLASGAVASTVLDSLQLANFPLNLLNLLHPLDRLLIVFRHYRLTVTRANDTLAVRLVDAVEDLLARGLCVEMVSWDRLLALQDKSLYLFFLIRLLLLNPRELLLVESLCRVHTSLFDDLIDSLF